jgi:hypothetical protein
LIVIVIVLAFVWTCSDNKVSRIHIKLEDTPQDKKTASNRPVPVPPPLICPPGGVAALEPSAPGTGHHKVFLRWNASKPPKDASGEVAGYCLYRSTQKNAAQKNPICRDCERVNIFPVSGTACVDDLVKDGAKYYYVAAAIGRNRDLSTPSNEITVEIPHVEHPVGDSPPGLYPSCRATPAQKESPSGH